MIGEYLSSWPPKSPTGAPMSDCQRYRYQLWRAWSSAPPLGFVMLNPSTADGTENDATICRCIRFAKDGGFGGIVVASLSPWRATSPKDLDLAIAKGLELGPALYQFTTEAMHGADVVVAAWGALSTRPAASRPSLAKHREAVVAALFKDRPDRDLMCLGRALDGSPKHPLYLRADQPMSVWRRASEWAR